MRTRTLFSSLLIIVLSVLALVATRRPAYAQNADVCYAVADQTDGSSPLDALVTLDRVTGVTTLVGFTGTRTIEAIALEPGGSGPLYASDGEQLGTLSLTTGAFTAKPETYGVAGGAQGEVELDDVDGLTVDLATGILYGTHRQRGATKDLLFQINKTTGAHVPNAWGAGVDYLVVDGPGLLSDLDDLAVSPTTGEMFVTSNDGGDGGVLARVNKTTGAATVIGEFGVDDIEALAYFNDGQLYGSTGKNAPSATRNRLYRINEATGAATLVAPFSMYSDYEALDCLTAPTSVSLRSVTVAISPLRSTVETAVLVGIAVAGLLTLAALLRKMAA